MNTFTRLIFQHMQKLSKLPSAGFFRKRLSVSVTPAHLESSCADEISGQNNLLALYI
jgi:hypothetical protein